MYLVAIQDQDIVSYHKGSRRHYLLQEVKISLIAARGQAAVVTSAKCQLPEWAKISYVATRG